jgi:hypothetical protein
VPSIDGGRQELRPIIASGVYYLWIANCIEDVDLTVNGEFRFKNPYGWLSGDEYFYLPVRFRHTTTPLKIFLRIRKISGVCDLR